MAISADCSIALLRRCPIVPLRRGAKASYVEKKNCNNIIIIRPPT